MAWLEDRQDERAKQWVENPPEVGDFVNLEDCFGDVWHEVLYVSVRSDDDCPMRTKGMFTVPRHNYAHKKSDLFFFHSIRKVIKRADFDMKLATVIIAKDSYYISTSDGARKPADFKWTAIEKFFGGIPQKMRYGIIRKDGVPIGEAARIDVAKRLLSMMKDADTLRIYDAKKRTFVME